MRGSVDPTVPWENDKATVVALREIAKFTLRKTPFNGNCTEADLRAAG